MQKKFLKIFVCAALIVCSLSVSAFASGCDHIWEDGACTECLLLCRHNFVDGQDDQCVFCGYSCPHSTGLGPCLICEDDACDHIDWRDGRCLRCGYYCSHSWRPSFENSSWRTCYTCELTQEQCSVCSGSFVGGYCPNCADVCAHRWIRGRCSECGTWCYHSSEKIPSPVDPSWSVCLECGYTSQSCYTCFGPFVNGYCPNCDSEPPADTDRIGVSLRDTVTSDMASGALVEVIALLPTLLLAVVGFIGIRKGLGFLLGRIRGV